MRFEDEITKWLLLYKRPSLKATSFDSLFRTVNNYIIPYLGNMEVNKITSDDIMNLIFDLYFKRCYSYSTVKKVKETLNCFFKYAVTKNMISTNIMVPVTEQRLKQGKKQIPRALSLEEIKQFSKSALEKNSNNCYRYYYGLLMLVYLHTGLRLGELLGCYMSDFDERQSTLKIHGNIACLSTCDETGLLHKGISYIHQDTPKTKDSERIVLLNETAKHYVQPYVEHSKKIGSQYLISSPTKNKFASISTVKHTYTQIAKNAGIENSHGIHTLRHTCATHLLRSGTDIKIVSKLLGHASVQITYDTYIHIFEKDIPDAFLCLDRLFATA